MTQQFHFWGFIQSNLNTSLKEYMHPYVHCGIIHNSQNMEASQVPINKQVGKNVVVHIITEYYLAIKKNGILLFVTAGWT